jgi:hypothetical protein
MSVATAPQFADPMFRLQFPKQAELLVGGQRDASSDIVGLVALRRR